MKSIPTLPGVEAESIKTSRLQTRVLTSGKKTGEPVIFLHGNLTSATWWEEVMCALPAEYRAIAPDLRGFGGSDPEKKIDARRGLADFVEDLESVLTHYGISKAHFVGNSMGGSIILSFLLDYSDKVLSATLVAPGSPYGFGGTQDAQGTPCYPDFAGSGGGLSNPEMLKRISDGDRTLESPFSPRAVLRALVYKPPFVPKREEELLSAALAIHLGEQDLPGDFHPSTHWPFVAPGNWGAANALSPKYASDFRKFTSLKFKPSILWIRGDSDLIVSDQAVADPATLGMMNLLPGWPGMEIYPPQPMLAQLRAVFEDYKSAGGSYREIVLSEAGHAPFLEKLEEFNASLHPFLARGGIAVQ